MRLEQFRDLDREAKRTPPPDLPPFKDKTPAGRRCLLRGGRDSKGLDEPDPAQSFVGFTSDLKASNPVMSAPTTSLWMS